MAPTELTSSTPGTAGGAPAPASSGGAPWPLVLRDLAIVGVTALAWQWDVTTRAALATDGSSTARYLPWLAALSAALLTALSGFLLHEWGHLGATLLSGGRVFYPSRITAPLLFHFDVRSNTRGQLLWMSAGGYAASLIGVALIAALAPLDVLSGRLALGAAGLGLVATLVGEVPTTIRVARGGALPDGYAFRAPS